MRTTPSSSPIRAGFAALIGVAGVQLAMTASRIPRLRLLGDTPYFIYMAQQLVAGRLPHLTTFDHKPPGTALLLAPALAAGRLVGIDDVVAVRLLWVLIGTAAVGLATWLGRRLTGRWSAGALGGVALLCSTHWTTLVAAGGEPKILVTALGLGAVAASATGRFVWAGVLGGSAALCWQPGALFLLAPVSLAIRNDPRSAALWRTGVGAFLPITLVGALYAAVGGLGELIYQTVTFNLAYVRRGVPTNPASIIDHIARIVHHSGGLERLLFLIGAWALLWTVLSRRCSSREPALSRALALTLLGFVTLSLINFQGPADALPMIAVAATGVSLATTSRVAGSWLHGGCWVVALTALVSSASQPVHGANLSQQRKLVRALAHQLPPEPRVFITGAPELLVLGGWRNDSRYLYLYSGVADSLRQREHRSVTDLFRAEARRVDLLAWSRLPEEIRPAAHCAVSGMRRIRLSAQEYPRLEGRYTIYIRSSRQGLGGHSPG